MTRLGNKGQILIFTIILMNSFIASVNIWKISEASELQDSLKDFLRGLGFPEKEPETYHSVPRLKNDYINITNIDIPSNPKMYIGGQFSTPGWVDTRWYYRKNITIDYTKVSANLYNFPVYIELYDSDLQNNAQVSGDDIIFTDKTGTVLAHEIESYNRIYNATHAKLVAWVNVNLSSSQDTIISMYYGNPSSIGYENPYGVWDSNYMGVWHLGEQGGSAIDSTSYGTSGAISGGVTQNIIGKLGKSYDFDGTAGTTVNFGDPVDGHLDFGLGSFTISFWLNIDQSTGDYQLPIYKGGTTDSESGYEMETTVNAEIIKFMAGDGTTAYSAGYPDVTFDTWAYMVGVMDRSSNYMYIYQDSNLEGSYDISSLGSVDNSNSLTLSPDWYELDGMMDEIRLSKSARSADWITTEYNNQNNPSSFLSLSSEEESLNDWLLPLYQYRKNIQINSSLVTGTLVNYPMLIKITDSDLTDSEKVQADGDDIAFATSEGWIWSEELMTNGGFETGNLAGWTISGSYWEAGTGPIMGSKVPQAGSYCAYVSDSGEVTDYIQQEIYVGSYSSFIDANKAILNASGWMISAESGSDYCSMTIEYLANDKSLISTALTYNNQLLSQWTEFAVISELIPVNTRYIRIKASSHELGWDAGSLDSFSMKIGTFQINNQGSKLAHETTYFNQTSGELIAWVNVPRISNDEDTNITLYYGNNALTSSEDPSKVWNQDYRAVWHFEEVSGSGSYILDSTRNGYDGDPSGTEF
ncbi:DUF2341 domain-containing protein, partial [Candidatus Hodarchaeum mangrovi]